MFSPFLKLNNVHSGITDSCQRIFMASYNLIFEGFKIPSRYWKHKGQMDPTAFFGIPVFVDSFDFRPIIMAVLRQIISS